MTIKRGAGKGDGGRGSNIVHQRHPGIYRSTIYEAPLMDVVLTDGEPTSFDTHEFSTPSTVCQILLFGSDKLVAMDALQRWGDPACYESIEAGADWAIWPYPQSTNLQFAAKDSAFVADIITPLQAGDGDFDAVMGGDTITAGVRVYGWPMYLETASRDFRDSAGGDVISSSVSVGAMFEGPGYSNRGAPLYDDQGIPSAGQAIINESAYTQAMYDAKNLFTLNGIEFEVVGLHYIAPGSV